jgi:5'-3' exonuclease
MGIPSYYKKLCDRIPGLLSKVRNGTQPSHLWIDFNCMVYHCLRRPGAKSYQGESTRLEWENHLIQDVCHYLQKIVKLVAPTEQVFIGVDGVVPMAKMRQQRLRRFKSQWIAAEEKRLGKVAAESERWDTNAITPGTAFMERLGEALCALRGPGLKYIVSTADEPGEGEHKAMRSLRVCTSKQSHVIYGLDADLILLSLLQPVKEMWLFREAVECGEVQYVDNEEEYRYFGIHTLRDYICRGQDKHYLLDYCMAMSFVGNDFLPHGLSLKLKDGGHDILLECLEEVRRTHGELIRPSILANQQEGFQWSHEALGACIQWFANREEAWVQRHCVGKIRSRHQPARGTTSLELAMDEWNKTPLRACEELALVDSIGKNEEGKLAVQLRADWQSVYRERWLGTSSMDEIVREYMKGLDWILQYYTGQTVDVEWCYPWFLPPLWSDMVAWLTRWDIPIAPRHRTTYVLPQEQLTLVLPLASWNLIRNKTLRGIPRLAPQLWPSGFNLFTAGHIHMWECEAQIPLFTPARLRHYLMQT